MVLVKSLLAFAMLALPAKAKVARKGENWVYFEDYLDFVVQRQGEDDIWDESRAVLERSMGTYWDVRALAWRPKERMYRNYEEKDGGCAIHFYFPDMLKRGEQRKLGLDEVTIYGRPLAMAPYCTDNKIPSVFPDQDFPRRSNNPDKKTDESNSVVFHEVNVKDWADDIDFVLSGRGSIADSSLEYVKIDDFIDGPIVWAGEGEQVQEVFKAFDYPLITNAGGEEVFNHTKILEWIKNWLDKEHGGKLPNPYRFGVGNKIWSDYTGIDKFWGYDTYGLHSKFPRIPQ